MQANRGRNTKPEVLVRKLLRRAGFPGYRLHWRDAPGCPDIAYPGRRVAIFVNGCFWHRCPYCSPPLPSANAEFWKEKLTANAERDTRNLAKLEAAGWKVVTVWECQLERDEESIIERIVAVLDQAS